MGIDIKNHQVNEGVDLNVEEDLFRFYIRPSLTSTGTLKLGGHKIHVFIFH